MREHVHGSRPRVGEIICFEDADDPAFFRVVEADQPGFWLLEGGNGGQLVSRLVDDAWTFATEDEAIRFYEDSGMPTSDAQAVVEALQVMRERDLTA